MRHTSFNWKRSEQNQKVFPVDENCNKPILHIYFYFSLATQNLTCVPRVSSFLPFSAEQPMNSTAYLVIGHTYLNECRGILLDGVGFPSYFSVFFFCCQFSDSYLCTNGYFTFLILLSHRWEKLPATLATKSEAHTDAST